MSGVVSVPRRRRSLLCLGGAASSRDRKAAATGTDYDWKARGHLRGRAVGGGSRPCFLACMYNASNQGDFLARFDFRGRRFCMIPPCACRSTKKAATFISGSAAGCGLQRDRRRTKKPGVIQRDDGRQFHLIGLHEVAGGNHVSVATSAQRSDDLGIRDPVPPGRRSPAHRGHWLVPLPTRAGNRPVWISIGCRSPIASRRDGTGPRRR